MVDSQIYRNYNETILTINIFRILFNIINYKIAAFEVHLKTIINFNKVLFFNWEIFRKQIGFSSTGMYLINYD